MLYVNVFSHYRIFEHAITTPNQNSSAKECLAVKDFTNKLNTDLR